MDNFTDLPNVAIRSSDIGSETLEAIWIVSSLAATVALTAIVGGFAAGVVAGRLRPSSNVDFHPPVYRHRCRSHVLWKDTCRI